jgi:dephospho-CoA kinase
VLRDAGIEVFTVKTDALTIRASDLEKAKELLNVKMPEDPKEIGDWRFSKDCCIKYPQERLTLLANGIKEILEPTFHEIPLTKEEDYDVDKICEIFEERKRVRVRADYPGSGKSFACEHMEKRGHKVLFVCPTNKLASNYKDKGVTMNKVFGIGLTEETRHTPFDSSQYDTVVFDEIFFANIKNLSRIKRYCDEHPEKIIIATGDTDQLECIDLITNQKNYDEYCNFCINVIFPDSIKLKENKRLKSKEHQKLLKRIKKDIFNESLPVRDIIERYFKMVNTLTTSFNIAFKNKTCEDVSQKVRRMLGKTQEYEEGEVLVCRKYTKLNKSKIVFNVNYEYTITEVREGTLCLDGEFWLPIPLIQKAFTHNYCRTCHSFQGSSIDDGITIFDWGNFFVNRKSLWTAVTRARSLDSIYFWKYDEKPENMNKLMEYFEQQVKRYKGQDLKAKRPFDEDNYITPNWLRSCIGTACQRCGDALNYEIVDRKVVCNLSAQRLDNTEPHEKDNCVPYCAMCNTSVSDRD